MLKLGLFYPTAQSFHAMSRSIAAGNPDVRSMEIHTEVARASEEIGLEYLFMADYWGSYGPRDPGGTLGTVMFPPVLAASLLAVTKHIHLITSLHTSWFHPLHLARFGATLATLSGGRWGINVVAGPGFADNLVGGPDQNLDHDERYVRATESMEIIFQAWKTGTVEFHGKHFDISGDLPGPRIPPEMWPLIVSAGASDAGREFAGRFADYVFIPGRTPLEFVRERVTDIRRVASEAGRDPEAIHLQMHASIIVGANAAQAEAAIEDVRQAVDIDLTLEYLSSVRKNISTYDDIYKEMGELQLREIGMVSGAHAAHGDVKQVADELQILHDEFGCSGAALTFPRWAPDEIRRFGGLVLPELERRGLWEHPAKRDWAW